MLDEKSIIPLYYQLKEILKEKIKDGSWKEGDMVPSERELMEMYSTSRATARKALDDLMIEGLIDRKQGIGTFVSPKKVLQDLTGEIAFASQIGEQGLHPSVNVIEAGIEKNVPNHIFNLFNLDSSESFFKICAVACANDDPLILGISYIPLKFAPNIEKNNFEKTVFFEHLENDHHIHFTHSILEIEPVLLDAFHAQYLKSTAGKPALSVERQYYVEKKLVLVEKRVVLGERTKYMFSLKHGADKDKDYSFQVKIDKEYGGTEG
ncbi:DNA-binding GntR family transcriptional regulator [Neobacillus niacini]|uniref:GntR family transcriptional regulator n=1 Tax=Neobacillus niacini TaxID=86668 RepID=UPI0010EE2A01|nr:GntR family transcriptional regulator [Neobacillus niacini]MDR7075726.1 DNA-binding GntR family transcriptional regulator [Neobacillus niacini]